MLAYFLQKLRAGVAGNAQFELLTATAIGLGFALSRSFAFPIQRRWGTHRVLVCAGETGLLAKDALNAQIEAASVRRIEVDPRANAEVLQRRL